MSQSKKEPRAINMISSSDEFYPIQDVVPLTSDDIFNDYRRRMLQFIKSLFPSAMTNKRCRQEEEEEEQQQQQQDDAPSKRPMME